MSYQMWGLASCPEICMTSTVLRVWTGGGGKRLVHEIFVSQAVFDDELRLPQHRRGVGVRLVGVGSAFGSNMIDVTAT